MGLKCLKPQLFPQNHRQEEERAIFISQQRKQINYRRSLSLQQSISQFFIPNDRSREEKKKTINCQKHAFKKHGVHLGE